MPDMATRRDLSGGAMACDASVQHAPREESKDRSRWRRAVIEPEPTTTCQQGYPDISSATGE